MLESGELARLMKDDAVVGVTTNPTIFQKAMAEAGAYDEQLATLIREENDPKEIFAGLTWLVYLVLIIYRSTADWRGRRAAWLGVLGFALVLCTLFGTRLLGGYHKFGLILGI